MEECGLSLTASRSIGLVTRGLSVRVQPGELRESPAYARLYVLRPETESPEAGAQGVRGRSLEPGGGRCVLDRPGATFRWASGRPSSKGRAPARAPWGLPIGQAP